MHRREKTMREERYKHEIKNPSFSSSLLDEIYRSTCDGATSSPDTRFYREPVHKKQSKSSSVIHRTIEEERMASLRRASLIEKWMDKRVGEKDGIKQRPYLKELDKKSHHGHHDQDTMFFSSTSSSSDSSLGGFSSSDSDSLHGSRLTSSCFEPPRPKPVRTSVSVQQEKSNKTKKTERSNPLFNEQREIHLFDDYHYNLISSEHTPKFDEDLIKSKSRALKIYSNLKKVKQPISPGGRLANFINSLFTAGNTTKKTKNTSSSMHSNFDDGFQSKSGHVSTCSSASSFTRSCLSKNSPSTRERLRNGVKRSVQFYPVSVIVDEDCRPCGHKSLYQEKKDAMSKSDSVPSSRRNANGAGTKFQVRERSERVDELARQFLKDYHQKNQIDSMKRNHYVDDEDDDDAASCSSSDLFELDHLSVMGKDRYNKELPVYETTHLDTNRAIANGFIM